MTFTDIPAVKLAEAPDVIKVDELRKVLRIGRHQAYALVNSGEIWSCRIGGVIRIPKQAIEEFLSGNSASKREAEDASC